MDGFVEVASAAVIPTGGAKSFLVADRRIAIYHTAHGYFASDNSCPHRGGPLAEGDLLGDEIVCPWHLWGFNVETGICAGNHEIAITTHEVRLDGERIFIRLAPEVPRIEAE